MNRSFRVYYALGFVACIAWTPFSIGQLEGDPEIFRAVADVWRENFESIDTWEGEVSIDVQFVGKDAIQIHGERVQITATFWYSKVDRALKRVVDTHVGKLPNGKDDIRRQTVLRLADSVHALRMTYPARESTEPRLATVTISSTVKSGGDFIISPYSSGTSQSNTTGKLISASSGSDASFGIGTIGEFHFHHVSHL